MMSKPEVADFIDIRPADRRHRFAPSGFLQVPIAFIVVTFALLAPGLPGVKSKAAPAGDDASPGKKSQEARSARSSDSFSAIRRTLKEQHDRMTGLANQLIEKNDIPEDVTGQLAVQRIRVESVKASLRSAEFAREAAEIALAEFEKGFRQEEANAEEEVKLARRELERLRRRIPQAKERRQKIEQASKGANINVAPLVVAELEEKKAGLQVEQAESKLTLLVNSTNPVRDKQLRSEVERAKAVELAARASVELEQVKLKQLQEAVKAGDAAARAKPARNSHDRQAIAALKRAIAVEEQLRPKVQQLGKNEKSDDRLSQEIHDLAAQLQSLINQAEIEDTAAQFDRMKAGIAPAANR